MKILVTGFDSFGSFSSNPSRLLAETCGRPFQVLEVSYQVIDSWIESIDPNSFDRLLHMGVDGGAVRLEYETVAHNVIGHSSDVRGHRPRRKRIERGGPWKAGSTLWHPHLRKLKDEPGMALSRNAGSYLCNYVLYRSLRAFPGKAVGFLHVPPLSRMPLDEQKCQLERLLVLLES